MRADSRAAPVVLGGDPIGNDGLLTDGTGGFTAVRTSDEDLGQPAILVSLSEDQFFTELRVIVFGIPSDSSQLRFDGFEYYLDLWKRDAYFSGDEPEVTVALDDPVGVAYFQEEPLQIQPAELFGNAGILAGEADTFDFRFDLTQVLFDANNPALLQSPLSAGEWVLGFQSRHEIASNGSLRVAGSIATDSPLPLFSRGDVIPRGILGGQDAENIVFRWGMSVSASAALPGDLDGDGDVDSNDLAIWKIEFGSTDLGDVDFDGDSDGADFLGWQRNLTIGSSQPLPVAVPEPNARLLAFACLFCWSINRGI